MPISIEKMQVAFCDACGTRRVASVDEPLLGATGTVQVDEDFGGYVIKFFSCQTTAEHIALAYARARETEFDPTPVVPVVVERSDDPWPKRRSPRRPADVLVAELRELWVNEGARPSITKVKRVLHVGEKRAKYLLNMTPDPT
jgi:hypothetical protein